MFSNLRFKICETFAFRTAKISLGHHFSVEVFISEMIIKARAAFVIGALSPMKTAEALIAHQQMNEQAWYGKRLHRISSQKMSSHDLSRFLRNYSDAGQFILAFFSGSSLMFLDSQPYVLTVGQGY